MVKVVEFVLFVRPSVPRFLSSPSPPLPRPPQPQQAPPPPPAFCLPFSRLPSYTFFTCLPSFDFIVCKQSFTFFLSTTTQGRNDSLQNTCSLSLSLVRFSLFSAYPHTSCLLLFPSSPLLTPVRSPHTSRLSPSVPNS